MARHASRTLTEVELEFMQILWDGGEYSPDDIQFSFQEKDRNLTGGSIRKVLSILMKKGYVTRRREGKGHVYHATVHRDQANRSIVRDILMRAFGGSTPLMLAALLDSRNVDEKELETIEKMITEHRRKEKRHK